MEQSVYPPFLKLLRDDRRYPIAAYAFVFESLEYAQNILKLGIEKETEPLTVNSELSAQEIEELRRSHDDEPDLKRHVTGQDLCEAARRYAILQYGMLARMVLDSIGIRSTGDIGNIVYNLMKIGHMRKTPEDRREDFDDVYDFDAAFNSDYKIGE